MMLSGNQHVISLTKIEQLITSFMSILKVKVFCKNCGMIKMLSRSTTKEEVNSVPKMLDATQIIMHSAHE